ncbi:class I adenylate-forming enzyme family protein [Plantactinospora sp. GCM10030261]|uniref:class I adenylate-forming enzyme family protein n=1 Tax=Plantactinospora sp. GCM10030261 TaxID=3273420 RepID=UPI00362117E3
MAEPTAADATSTDPGGSRYDRDTSRTAALLDARIREHARRHGERPALVVVNRHGSVSVSWAELDAASGRLADHLPSTAGSPFCSVTPLVNHDATELVALVATMRVSAPTAVLNARLPAALRDAHLSRVRETGYVPVVSRTAAAPWPHAQRPTATKPPVVALPPHAVLLASGGSTGHSKLVIDHLIRSAPARPEAVRPFLNTGWRAGQCQLVCSPLYHAAGLAPFVEGLVAGNTTVVAHPFDGSTVGTLIAGHAVDWVQMTPYHMASLLTGNAGPDSWKHAPTLVHLADRCPARVKRRFHAALGARKVFEMYGASEGIGMTMARGDEWEERPGTVGRGFFTHLRVMDNTGRILGPDEVGEVHMRAGVRQHGTYLGATGRLRVGPDGFATLGDTGHLDHAGYLYLAPRQLATINVAGVTVSPSEVEAELSEHPQIADVAVCAQPDAAFGERVVAIVVPATALTADEVRRWAIPRMAPAQVPSRYVFTAALPRADTGKLDRTALPALVRSDSPRQRE